MTLSVFQSSVSNHDTDGFTLKSTVLNNHDGDTNATIGSTSGKSAATYWSYFILFDLTGIPAGSTINGCELDFMMILTVSAQASMNLRLGFMAQDGIWNGADGFSEEAYAKLEDLPFAYWNQGSNTDVAVWIDGIAAAGTLVNMPAYTNNVRWSLGDGTGVSPVSTLAGLAAHCQLAIDAGGADPLVALHMHRVDSGNITKRVDFDTCDAATGSDAPILRIDWTPPPPTATFVIVRQPNGVGVDMTVKILGTFTDLADDSDLGSVATWTSSLEGLMHTGATFDETDLRVGVHTMTVSVTDSNAQTTNVVFTITVFDVPADIANMLVASTVIGPPNTSLQIAGGVLAVGAGGDGTKRGAAVIDRII